MTTDFSTALQPLLDTARKDVRRKAVEALYRAGQAGVEESVRTGNYKDRTGGLRSSVYSEVDEPLLRLTLAAAAPYAIYVERIANRIVLDKGILKMQEVLTEELHEKGIR